MSSASEHSCFYEPLNKDGLHRSDQQVHDDASKLHAMSTKWTRKRVIVCIFTSLALLGVLVTAAFYSESITESASGFNRSEQARLTKLENNGEAGAPWTEEEALIVKAKLWEMYSWTRVPLMSVLRQLHPDWEGGPWQELMDFAGRFAPTAIRLGFHGCLRDRDGTGGCDGCLYGDGIDRIWMDYIGQNVVPYDGPHAPNFNDGLKPVMEVLEEIYTNPKFPGSAPYLETSLQDLGKSRGDLWAFAAITAVEFTSALNNAVCLYPKFESFGIRYPDSLDSNSQWGRHCSQKQDTPECDVDPGNRITFRTGRRDCKNKLYQVVRTLSCPPGLDIATEDLCQRASAETGAAADFSDDPDGANCKVTLGKSFPSKMFALGLSLCHLSVQQKYDSKPHYQVWNPLGSNIPLHLCRPDLNITTEDDCKQAAEYLFLPYVGDAHEYHDIPTLDVSGCYVGAQLLWGGRFKWVVKFATGLTKQPTPERRDIRSICHFGNQKVRGYMANHWGKNPGNQMSGDQTVDFMSTEFGLNPRETIALLGAHTVGRFHSRASMFRYIWIRNGGMMWNNEYYRNMAGRPGYRFLDDCTRLPNATGQPGTIRWDSFRRGEQVNKGPIEWILQRHACPYDCRTFTAEQIAERNCCQNMPEGGACNPTCDKWFSEGGNHEMMLPSEIGFYYKFDVDPSTEKESGCPGMVNFDRSGGYFSGEGGRAGPVGCPLQDRPAGELKMHEVVELYADNQNLWAKEFNEVMEKVLQNGYDVSELTETPDTSTDVVCPWQFHYIPDLAHYTCFNKKQLSEPFRIKSMKDGNYLQVSPTTGNIETAPFDESFQHQKWHLATGVAGMTRQLVNGLHQMGVGKMTYDFDNGKGYSWLRSPQGGCLARGWHGDNILYQRPCRATPTSANLYRFQAVYNV